MARQVGGRLKFDAVERAIIARPTAAQRGLAFEDAARYLLTAAAEYRFPNVWRWADWPARTDRGFGWQDLGIDLVAETAQGAVWAVQIKFRSRSTDVVPWRELATFVGHSARPDVFAHRLVITNTWAVSPRFERATAGQSIGWLGRAELLGLGLDWRPFLEPDATPQPRRRVPRPHQQRAIAEVVSHLSDHERGQLLMACGTGKTLTSLWISEARGDQRILVLVPSLSLLRQFRREWLEAADPGRPIFDLCVCSDVTVAGGHVRGYADDLIERATDLGVPVTADPATIAAFLRGGGRRVVFATYQSSARIAEAMSAEEVPVFDLVIADEAHRLAAATDRSFATVLDGSRIRARRRLFATATPRILTSALRRRAAEEDLEVVSMDDPAIFGEIAHRLSFGQAIAEDLLADYRVVVLATSDAVIAGLVEERRLVTSGDEPVTDAATLATLAGVRRSVAALGLRRLISFHRTIRRAEVFAEAAGVTRSSTEPSIDASFVSGAMTAGDRAMRLDRLTRSGENAVLLANARCLTEGVDVPGLDGVVFVDPRWSPIDIVQAVGRVIRRADGKRIGTIVIPVVVPETGDPDVILERSGFATVWAVVRALRSHDDRLAEELSEARMALGRTGRVMHASFLQDHFGMLDLPLTIDPGQFADAINLRIIDAGSFAFEEGLGRLETYAASVGHSSPPRGSRTDDGFALGLWVARRRDEYRAGRLRPDRVASLSKLPSWSWDPFGDDFDQGLAALLAFQAERGHARVPQSIRTAADFALGTWVNGRRGDFRAGRLGPDRIAALEAIDGWVWNPYDEDFETGLMELSAFAASRGHAQVPKLHRTASGFRLGSWVDNRRLEQRKGRLDDDRVRRLESQMGWSWDPQTDQFKDGLARLHRYVVREGSARVPHAYRDETGFRLGAWVANRRNERRAGQLSDSQIAALGAVPGWVWDPFEDDFQRGIDELRTFVRERGHARVPDRLITETGFPLGSWVSARRMEFLRKRLSPERAGRLAGISGWSWDPRADRFAVGLKELHSYVEAAGHANVPRAWVSRTGYRLGPWVSKRRAEHRSGRLAPDRAAELERLPGWTWITRDIGPPGGST